jgi:tetratricopeptide (TPR) repeat protein
MEMSKEKVPTEAWALFENGLTDESNGKKEEAKNKYEKAVEIYPEFEGAWINLAMVYQDLGDFMMPIVVAKQALEHLPTSSALWLSLGTFYNRIQIREDAAEEAYRKALEYNPNNTPAAMNLGFHLANHGKLEEAEKLLTTSREAPLDEQYSESKEAKSRIWAQLALIRARLGMTDKARAAIKSAMEFDTSDPIVRRTIAQAEAIIGDMKAVSAHTPNDAESWYRIALTLDQQRDYPKAVEAFKRVMALDPNHPYAQTNLGAVLVDMKEYAQAEEILQAIVKKDTSNYMAWMNLGKALLAQEKNVEGENALQQVIKHEPDYVNAWYQLGLLYDRLRRMQDAEAAYRKTVEHKPDHYQGWSDLGVLLIEMGRNAEAEAPLRNATKFGPDDPKPWANLGIYLTMMNRCEEAKQVLDKAIKISPQDRHVRQLQALWDQSCVSKMHS